MTISDRDRGNARAAIDGPHDFTGGSVDRTRGDVKIPLSARVTTRVSEAVIAEAVSTGKTPSEVVNELLTEALAARSGDSQMVVSLKDLHRAVYQIAHPAA